RKRPENCAPGHQVRRQVRPGPRRCREERSPAAHTKSSSRYELRAVVASVVMEAWNWRREPTKITGNSGCHTKSGKSRDRRRRTGASGTRLPWSEPGGPCQGRRATRQRHPLLGGAARQIPRSLLSDGYGPERITDALLRAGLGLTFD